MQRSAPTHPHRRASCGRWARPNCREWSPRIVCALGVLSKMRFAHFKMQQVCVKANGPFMCKMLKALRTLPNTISRTYKTQPSCDHARRCDEHKPPQHNSNDLKRTLLELFLVQPAHANKRCTFQNIQAGKPTFPKQLLFKAALIIEEVLLCEFDTLVEMENRRHQFVVAIKL